MSERIKAAMQKELVKLREQEDILRHKLTVNRDEQVRITRAWDALDEEDQ